MNVQQDRKIKEVRKVIFSVQLWGTFLSVKAEVWVFTMLST